jgi:hypothetical protein
VFLPNAERQFRLLEGRADDLFRDLHLAIPQNLKHLLRDWLGRFMTTKPDTGRLPDALLTGSLLEPSARVIAARMKSRGVPVTSVFHGDSCGVQDEPVFGYGENSYADVVVGYGQTGCDLAVSNTNSASLFGSAPQYVSSSSPVAARLYRGPSVRRLSEIESPRIMYVPTSLTGSGRYGPYRDMHDCAYLQWQLHLLRALREVLPASAVTWKRHAKEHVSLSLPAIEGVKTSDQPFDQVIGDADVFVFDYVSSAFSQAAATDKPIILVEIGFRNIAPTAMNAIDARCIRVNADPARPVEALRAAIDRSAKLCVNTYTEAFSIAPGSSSRTESAASAIRSAVDQLGLVGKDSR